ncbi:cryptochrome/photolyase family protein [Candidatus Nanohalococcus occultus]|uniref:cryptochrome/photolyase family protein n=1 Tax=Candidatus Nanohalococcus occultus TaxID=2978047 RepID=UPI0039DF3ECE
MTAIVWIRRSMRKHDNTALVQAAKEHDEVIPFYVVDENYFETADLGYPRVSFWHDSLTELKETLQDDGQDLVVRKGKPLEQLQRIIEETNADKVYYNRDYSPYARKRDEKVEKNLDCGVESFKDLVMFEKREILTNSGDPYSVYSYYSKKWFKRDKSRPEKPEGFETPELESDEIPSLKELGFEKPEGTEVWEGGRENGLKRLENFKERIWDYEDRRDLASQDGTSKLSPHFKFGTVSIREAFWASERVKARNPNEDSSGIKTWQEELAWRDFYFQMIWNFPYTVDEPYLEKYGSIEWKSKEEAPERWEAWKEGKTGFPFVDAGMRQLKQTGWMHNRLRMVVTSFSSKDLWLDWRDVHEYFSKMFIDAEVSAMVGGIQWAYSIGTDAQPYFRVFNPISQGQSHDSDGEYIRRHVEELENVPGEYIHEPWKMPEQVQEETGCIIGEDYPEPIVDHSEQREKAIKRFEEAKED